MPAVISAAKPNAAAAGISNWAALVQPMTDDNRWTHGDVQISSGSVNTAKKGNTEPRDTSSARAEAIVTNDKTNN